MNKAMNGVINGYQLIEEIHNGAKTVIYRGKKESASGEAIVKTLKAEYPTLEEIARLRHEYQILDSLDLSGTIKTLALEDYGNGVAIILEEFGSESLEKYLAKEKLSLVEFLKIAIKLVEVLAEVHQSHVIHKDIKPHNILIDAVSGQIKLIDFSIATRLTRERASISNPDLLEGTLAYMAPEQTGRMNRSIDYRTDFYCLGITFYEMLTGQLPFTTTDPMELVHSHIAQIPVPPQEVNPEIPAAISEIVMKLVAKNAEDRYQSALGIKADLEECLFQWQTKGTIENLIPGERDKSGQFLIPQKLYGRSAEVAELMAAFDRASSGLAEMILVSGYSGVGKTAVINEVHKPIVRQRGYFIAGKFDQMGRNVPYAALVQAFRELVRQLLTESSEQIADWKEQLLAALGENGRVIIDTIPEVELIIGSAPEVPELPPTESQNRFKRTFKQFVRVFTKQEHPLVLFLDDLQWADLASLKLIELLVADTDSKYLLFVGAYRDNEVSPTHPTIQTIEKIQSAGAAVNNIVLAPLDQKNVSLLIADTLQESERSQELSELLFNKTQGNPFFLTQLLNTLHQEGLIVFDFTEGRWLWDIDRIQSIGIADYTVVELVARNIKKLSAQTQERLKQAACMGNIFHLDVLAVVNEESLVKAADYLWEALQAGLILPLNNAYKISSLVVVKPKQEEGLNFNEIRVSYKFLHDRVQQAAYSLIPESEKKATHLKIGRLLLEKTSGYALNENLFDIVNQLNIGVEFITELAERERLAQLNLMAGKKAKISTAYEAASEYLSTGLELLPEASWESHYELTRDIHVEALEASYLTINFDRASQLSEIVLERVKTQLEKIKVYELKIPYYFSQNQMQDALDTALQVLEMLGVNIPKKPKNVSIMIGLITTKLALGRKQVEDLAELPQMNEPYKIAAIRILMNVVPATFTASPALFPLIIFKMVTISIKYGNSPLSAYGYCMYGMIMCGILGDINNGYRFGQLALNLLEKFHSIEVKSKVNFLFNAFVRHWKEHIKETIEPYLEAFQASLKTGDLEYACNSANGHCYNLFWKGQHLEVVAKTQKQYIDLGLKYKQYVISENAKPFNQLMLNLIDTSNNHNKLVGEIFNEEQMLPAMKEANNNTGIAWSYLAKTLICYIFNDYNEALENAIVMDEYKQNLVGTIAVVQHNLYYSLTLIAHYPDVAKKEKKQYLKKVVSHQKQMKKWASHAPCNFQHKYDLVEAEKARVLGQETTAMALYDRAIAGAKENRYVQEEAIANELAAEFHLARGSEKIAKTYMTEAYYGYIRWGAKAKVKDLDEKHPDLISRSELVVDSEPLSTTTKTSSTGTNTKILDLATVVKASQAISGEIIPSNLLKKMMIIAIENAGARNGSLLVKHEGQWVAEASGTVAGDEVTVEQSSSASDRVAFPAALINYVERTGETLVIDNASHFGQSKSQGSGLSPSSFQNDPYIQAKQPKSILCLPIVHHGKLSGILYLENNLIAGVFTNSRVEILNLLSSQISISIENARLYAREQEKSQQLAESLEKLQQTQTQLVHTEKISSLGQLVAGVAHEVNNPVGFISGNVHHAREYVENLLEYLELYRKHYPNPPEEIVDMAEEIDLEFIEEDLPNMLASMQLGTDRIREIMQSLRNFSRVDKGKKKPADIHAGIESTLMILGHRLKAKPERPEIKVVKEYGSLPEVICFSGQLNQVFMNLMANSIDAMEEAISSGAWEKLHGDGGSELCAPTIRISTEVRGSQVAISIADNGPGMPEAVRSKLFKAFFTTKPEGKGTGLGLSISYQIVTEKHGGTLQCNSAPGQGAEFIIEIPINEEF